METVEQIIAEAARLLTMSGIFPAWAVICAVIGIAVLLVLAPSIGRAVWAALKLIRVEPTDPPVSDGGTREDEDRRALVSPEITQPIPTREQGNSEGNG